MIDWIVTFVSGVLFSPLFLVVVFFGAILVETYEKMFWSIVLGALTLISLWGIFDVSILTGLGWYTLLAIFVIGGVVHAFWRWFRSTTKATEKFNRKMKHFTGNILDKTSFNYGEGEAIHDYRNATNYRENLDRIAYWILAWPVSGAAHFLGDIVLVVKDYVIKIFAGVFDKISMMARSKAVIDISKLDN